MILLVVSDAFACPLGVVTNLGVDEDWGSRSSDQKQQTETHQKVDPESLSFA